MYKNTGGFNPLPTNDVHTRPQGDHHRYTRPLYPRGSHYDPGRVYIYMHVTMVGKGLNHLVFYFGYTTEYFIRNFAHSNSL